MNTLWQISMNEREISMKKFFSLLMALILTAGFIPVIATPVFAAGEDISAAFKDPNFLERVQMMFWEEGMTPGNVPVTAEKCAEVTELWIRYRNIEKLDGLEYFINLETLYIDENKLTEVDLSQNTQLKTLYCGRNELTELDLSNNPNLEVLNCSSSLLTALDISHQPNLQTLICDDNQLSSLNIASNPTLISLDCHNNLLTALDVTQNPALASLDVRQNLISSEAKITGLHPGITTSYQFHPQKVLIDEDISTAFADPNFLKSVRQCLDKQEGEPIYAWECEAQTALNIMSNDIASLAGLEYFPNLTEFYCGGNRLTELDLSFMTQLERLTCEENQITDLDVSMLPALYDLSCSQNPLTELNLSGNPALAYLRCTETLLAALDLSQNPALINFVCSGNQITALDLSNNFFLEYLDCSRNKIRVLDVSSNTALKKVFCARNKLNTLLLGNCEALDELDCCNNQLTVLDVSDSATLNALDARFNYFSAKSAIAGLDEHTPSRFYFDPQISTAADITRAFTDANFLEAVLEALDKEQGDILTAAECAAIETLNVQNRSISCLNGLQYFTKLTDFNCSCNQLTALDLSSLATLEYLDCADNQLTELDVSALTKLLMVDCSDNQLALLDVSKNTALTTVDCGNNRIAALDVSKNVALRTSIATKISSLSWTFQKVLHFTRLIFPTTISLLKMQLSGWIIATSGF
jgi:hypothetical protein